MKKVPSPAFRKVFDISNLVVVPELLGSSHLVIVESIEFFISLPSLEDIKNERDWKGPAYCRSWAGDVPDRYHINNIVVECPINDELKVPDDALNTPRKDSTLIRGRDGERVIEEVVKKHDLLADKAFQNWVDFLKWTSGLPLIGIVTDLSSGFSRVGTLFDKESGHDIYSPPYSIEISDDQPVSEQEWESAQQKLKSFKEIPVYIKFIHNSQVSFELGHRERAIIELAMAADVFVRIIVLKDIPSILTSEFVTYIEEANFNAFLNRFYKEKFPSCVAFKRIRAELSSLMARRNKYIHMGEMSEFDDSRYSRYLNAVHELISVADQ